MKLFGFDIRFGKSRVPGTLAPDNSGWQLRPVDGQGPFTSYFSTFVPRKIDPAFFEFLIESVPICGAAINKLVTLDGIPIVTGSNQKLVDEINEWMQHVPVNDIQKGLQAFHQGISREAFEQGFSFGEFITDKKRSDIIGLRVADSKFIKFSRDDSGLRVYQRADNDNQDRELNQENLIYFSVNNENTNPYGTPVLRGCEFVSKIITTIYQATANTWTRFGDPPYSIIYKTSRKDGADLEARRKTITDEINAAARAKAAGKSVDFVRAIDKDSDITISVLGADNSLILDMDVPMKYLVQDICGITGLPAWMLGYSFSTTERRATFEAEMVLADVAVRQQAKAASFERLIRSMLLLRGRTWKPGDWQIEWKQVNLHDMVAQAQARFLNAQADMMGQGAAQQQAVETTTEQPKAADCGCGEDHIVGVTKMVSGVKESRPIPWPELDKVEADYEARLKTDWQELAVRIFTIAKFDPASLALVKAPLEEAFTLTPEQLAEINRAVQQAISEYSLSNPDTPLNSAYGESYSLGLDQAAKLAGADRPILDIIKNKEIYDELRQNGFELVKDNITRAITDKIIPEMQAHVIAGSNPLSVAERLKKQFGDQNSSWERLARTEMALAAETAKTNEWQKRGIKKVEFYPAPDACPICQALKGTYDLDKCPRIPVHPRCRCSKRPAASEAE
ncbi:MAG: minor capsid protein [Geobacter sp.]